MRPTVLEGERYGSLVTIRVDGVNRSKKRRWLCKCDCGRHQIVLSPHLRSGRARSCNDCSRTRQSEARKIPIEQRFWARVVKHEPGCWEWTGFLNHDGYGLLSRGRTKVGAHRLSWEIHFGSIPDGMYVCHHCDNPQCARPDHLFLGTQRDNMRDCGRKRRNHIRAQDGEQNTSAALTNADARRIREMYATSMLKASDIAAQVGVSRGVVASVVSGRTYREAGGPVLAPRDRLSRRGRRRIRLRPARDVS
jgi:HNH endonuclease